MTTWKAYEELTEEQQAAVREIIRKRWIRDARAERRACPNGWEELTEILEQLRTNDETTRAWIEDNCELDNVMYTDALEELEAAR